MLLRANTSAFLTILAVACLARADPFVELEPCEEALGALVTKLVSENKLVKSKKVESLPKAYSEYSFCRPFPVGVDGTDFLVLRDADDVTVFVSRSTAISPAFQTYGPFYSAYRKYPNVPRAAT